MLVSSKHLSLASKVFKAMLLPNFREGSALARNGKTTIPPPDDVVGSMSIIMSIIHAGCRKVPEKVTESQLSKLALVVDKYKFHNPVIVYAQMWIGNLSFQSTIIVIWRERNVGSIYQGYFRRLRCSKTPRKLPYKTLLICRPSKSM